jgi:hypothetical protein
MFFRSLRKIGVVVPLVALMSLAGCRGESGDDTYRNEQISKLLNKGKTLLAKNQWGLARETFTAVLTCDADGDGDNDFTENCGYDSSNSEARFGIVLADLLSFTDTIRLVSSLLDGFAPASASSEENKFVNQLITDLIHDLRAKFQSIDQNLLLVEGNPGFKFRINELPIYLTNDAEPTVDMSGEWDRADAFLINALVRAVIGILDYADSIDLQLDVLRAYDYFSQSAFDLDKFTHVEGLITYILNDPNYPNFLSVKKDGGNELVASAAHNLGQAVYNFQVALYMASIETDSQSDDILQYVDANSNGRYDPPIDRESDKCAHLAALLADPAQEARASDESMRPENFSVFGSKLGSTKDLPFLSEQTACLLQKAYYGLSWEEVQDTEAAQKIYTAAPRINFRNDLVPLLDSIVAGIFEDMDGEIASLLARQGLLSSLLDDILGDAIELDLNAFFAVDGTGKRGNIRGLLPAWEAGVHEDPSVDTARLVLEMECSADGTNIPGLMTEIFAELELPACKKSWVNDGFTADVAHFEDYADLLEGGSIGADGFVGYLPYIGFQDASMHGLLWLNLAAVSETFTSKKDVAIRDGLAALDGNINDFNKASLTDLNAFIAALSANGTIKGFLLGE